MPDDALTPRQAHPWVAEAATSVRFGVSYFPHPADWGFFIEMLQRMEALGYDSYWNYDHPTARVDCWSVLAVAAMATERLRLGTLVACIYYRSPYLLARSAADIDRLSNGRLVLGLGIGDDPAEFAAMGLPYPPTRERLRAMDEVIQIVRGLWSGEPFSFTGEFFAASSDGSFLLPVQEPYVPILLAGGGEKVTLRQVARYADVSNMGAHATIGNAVTGADIARKFAKLDEYCAEYGRPPDSVLRSHFAMPLIMAETPATLRRKLAGMDQEKLAWCGDALFAGTPEETIAFYQRLVALGFQYFLLNILDGDHETIELAATTVLPALRQPAPYQPPQTLPEPAA
jgi:alkanesulfonate monooxygenase SsuD/methylene tetrahydromethanopterin reductase-like flavin-dependent oxidoreductase (luciferase family)